LTSARFIGAPLSMFFSGLKEGDNCDYYHLMMTKSMDMIFPAE